MALFSKQSLRNKAQTRFSSSPTLMLKGLTESSKSFSSSKRYDIFLSHSFLDAEIVSELHARLTGQGYSVYVDWLEDSELDRSKVTVNTARQIRDRMKSCRSLIYAFSTNSPKSVWMPWELGYFDGYNGKVAVLPIVDTDTSSDSFTGTEYVALYPYIVDGTSLWVHTTASSYEYFTKWLPK